MASCSACPLPACHLPGGEHAETGEVLALAVGPTDDAGRHLTICQEPLVAAAWQLPLTSTPGTGCACTQNGRLWGRAGVGQRAGSAVGTTCAGSGGIGRGCIPGVLQQGGRNEAWAGEAPGRSCLCPRLTSLGLKLLRRLQPHALLGQSFQHALAAGSRGSGKKACGNISASSAVNPHCCQNGSRPATIRSARA